MPIINSNLAETITIQENGVYDVAKYSGANINVSPNLQDVNVTPSTSQQTILPQTYHVDGFGRVQVSPVTSSIDSNITTDNIKNGVTILGVTGSYSGGGGGGTEPYLQLEVDSSGVLKGSTSVDTVVDLCGATNLSPYVLSYAYAGNQGIDTVFFNSLENITGDYSLYSTFMDCSNITSASFYNLLTVDGASTMMYCFQSSSLQDIDLSALSTVSGSASMAYCFSGCYNLEALYFLSLSLIGSSAMEGLAADSNLSVFEAPMLLEVESGGLTLAFSGCSNLTSVYIPYLYTLGTFALQSCFARSGLESLQFPSLKFMYEGSLDGCFSGCDNLVELYFPSLSETAVSSYEGAFTNMLDNTTGVTVHFPENLETAMSQFSDVISGFGGTDTVVMFDLPKTYLIETEYPTPGESLVLERNPANDNLSVESLAWKDANNPEDVFNSFWTAGSSNPNIGDPIYDDDACTNQVATVNNYYSPIA